MKVQKSNFARSHTISRVEAQVDRRIIAVENELLPLTNPRGQLPLNRRLVILVFP